MQDIQQKRQELIQAGINPDTPTNAANRKNFIAEYASREMEIARQRHNAERTNSQWKPAVSIIKIGLNVVVIAFVTLAIVLGLPFVLIGGGWIEAAVMSYGLAQKFDPGQAAAMAVILVVAVAVLNFIRSWLAHDGSVEPERIHNLKDARDFIEYMVRGAGRDRFVKETPALKEIDGVLTLLSILVVMLSVYGRMALLLEANPNIEGLNWFAQIFALMQQDLMTVLALATAVLMPWVLIRVNHFAVKMIYQLFHDLTGGIGGEGNFTGLSSAALEQQLESQWYDQMLLQQQQRDQRREAMKLVSLPNDGQHPTDPPVTIPDIN